MVGGVSPKKAGTIHLGLPVFGSVKEVSEPLLAVAYFGIVRIDRSLCVTCGFSCRLSRRHNLTRL